jgi:hypothetical protein
MHFLINLSINYHLLVTKTPTSLCINAKTIGEPSGELMLISQNILWIFLQDELTLQ